jgi:hypothetical protein
MARSVTAGTHGLFPKPGVDRLCHPPPAKAPFDLGSVKTFSIFQELHAAWRDPRRRDHLSIFWLYRVCFARMPAPESDPGSGIARNEPQGEPGARGPNLIIHIANP